MRLFPTLRDIKETLSSTPRTTSLIFVLYTYVLHSFDGLENCTFKGVTHFMKRGQISNAILLLFSCCFLFQRHAATSQSVSQSDIEMNFDVEALPLYYRMLLAGLQQQGSNEMKL